MLNIIIREYLPSYVHSSCWMQDAKSERTIRLLKVCFDYGASLVCIFITNLRLELSSIYFFYFFYFPHLFINIFSIINPKNHFSTIDQGFPICEKSLEALFWFISSPRTFFSFHRSFSVAKSKNTKKIASDFNLLTFFPMDSTSTCHCYNLKIRFEELSIICLIRKSAHSTTAFLRVLVP